jgi:hypothetical protein
VESVALWLQVINSDVFSAVEKDSPTVTLRQSRAPGRHAGEAPFTIRRSERGMEGEEFLEMLDPYGHGSPRRVQYRNTGPHMAKLSARTEYLKGVIGDSGPAMRLLES